MMCGPGTFLTWRYCCFTELRSEFSEAPEVFEMEHKDKITEKAEEQEVSGLSIARCPDFTNCPTLQMERQRYEEENFTRLPMTKEQKKLEKAARQRHARFDILGDLESKPEQPILSLL